jgi:hypothetical protein
MSPKEFLKSVSFPDPDWDRCPGHGAQLGECVAWETPGGWIFTSHDFSQWYAIARDEEIGCFHRPTIMMFMEGSFYTLQGFALTQWLRTGGLRLGTIYLPVNKFCTVRVESKRLPWPEIHFQVCPDDSFIPFLYQTLSWRMPPEIFLDLFQDWVAEHRPQLADRLGEILELCCWA